MIGWNFPSNGGGLIRGVAEAGIQTFTGKEISSLAREICQNSLDAAVNENFAVTVEFQRYEIYSKNISGYSDYKNILSKCREFWINNTKATRFLDNALAQISLRKTFVLRISDFNTTGLGEPFNPRLMEGWNALTKIDGGATKTGDAAGSFGIGKNAPFANSFYRLIFYRTLNLQGERAAQGMSRLMSFQCNTNEVSAGVGYYGESETNLPVKKIDALEDIFLRKDSGTDIFIYGFNGDGTWRENIFVEILENFLVAIHQNKLRVNLQGLMINKNTLGELLNKYGDKLGNSANYYKILSGNGDIKFSERDFHSMGTLKLGVLLDSKAENLNRKVLIVRKNGMKLFELKNFPRSISFTGILELEGRKLNEFFREMETPAHDNWEPGRYEKNPKLAKAYLTELKNWVREKISNISMENISDEVDVEGLGHMLDFDDSLTIGDSQKAEETLDNPATPEIELVPVASPKKTFSSNGGNDYSKTQRTKGDITDDKGDNDAIRKLGGSRKRKTLAEHSGEKNPDGQNIILEPSGRRVACNKTRVVKLDKRNYTLILEVPQDISGGKIEIFSVGEDNSHEKLSVIAADSVDTNSQSRAENDEISFRNMRAGVNVRINFELQDEKNYALGVNIYED